MARCPPPEAPRVRLDLRGWRDPAIIALACMALASGFGQFGAVTALGDVAKAFGHAVHGASLADRAGLSGTELGIGLAVLRLASLGSLPLSGLADRFGRRSVLVVATVLGLLSPSRQRQALDTGGSLRSSPWAGPCSPRPTQSPRSEPPRRPPPPTGRRRSR